MIKRLSIDQEHYVNMVKIDIDRIKPTHLIYCGGLYNPKPTIRSPDYLRSDENKEAVNAELSRLIDKFYPSTETMESLEKETIIFTPAETTLVTSNQVFGHPYLKKYKISTIPGNHIHIAYCSSIRESWFNKFHPTTRTYGSEGKNALAKFRFMEPEEMYNNMLKELFDIKADVALRKGDELLIRFYVPDIKQ